MMLFRSSGIGMRLSQLILCNLRNANLLHEAVFFVLQPEECL